jgi:hypothetical protein
VVTIPQADVQKDPSGLVIHGKSVKTTNLRSEEKKTGDTVWHCAN